MSFLGVEKQNYSDNVYYHEGKTKKILPEISCGVNSALEALNKNTNSVFFETIDVHLMSRIKDLNPFNKYSNLIKSNESSSNFLAQFKIGDSDIYLNQKAILQHLKKQDLTDISTEDFTKHLVMHEAGHYFDEYYGCKIKNYSEIIDYLNSLPQGAITNNYDISKLHSYLKDNNSLSDEKIYKDALLEDLSNLNKKELYSLGLISESDFINPNFSIKNFIKITKDNFFTYPETSDVLRSEIFAQIFSYTMGSDDSYKNKYLESFPNTTKIILNLINEKKNLDNNDIQKFEILF